MRTLITLCYLATGGLAGVVPAQRALDPDIRAKIDGLATTAREQQQIPALSLAIGREDGVVYAKAFGYADLEHRVAATPETVFRTASIAKSLTAVGVMQLAERGKLDLDAPFRTIYADWPKKRWPLSCRQLLGHLGGIRHYNRPGEATGTKTYGTLAATLELFQDDPLLHEPGTAYSYTTYGFTLLGLAIEHASGQRYADYMHENVFEPAGMKLTMPDTHYRIIPNRARGYMRLERRTRMLFPASARDDEKLGVANAPLHDTGMKIPGGGLLSAPSDLVRFGLALLGGKLVQPKTRDAMWTEQKTASGKPTRYGLGFGLGTGGGMRIVSHSGGQAGTSALMYILPEKKLALAVMTNLQRARLRGLLRDAGKAVLGLD